MDFYTYKARVERIIDGDTLLVSIDLGLDIWLTKQRMRLAHLNAPELPTEAGRATVATVAQLLGPLPASVVLQTLKDKPDRYGRYLGVFVTEDGVNVNEYLVQGGWAVPYEGVGPSPAVPPRTTP